MLRRTVHECAPLRDDPVIRRMGLPDDPELEGLVEWVVDRVRRHWLWKVCPAAMYSQEYVFCLATPSMRKTVENVGTFRARRLLRGDTDSLTRWMCWVSISRQMVVLSRIMMRWASFRVYRDLTGNA